MKRQSDVVPPGAPFLVEDLWWHIINQWFSPLDLARFGLVNRFFRRLATEKPVYWNILRGCYPCGALYGSVHGGMYWWLPNDGCGLCAAGVENKDVISSSEARRLYGFHSDHSWLPFHLPVRLVFVDGDRRFRIVMRRSRSLSHWTHEFAVLDGSRKVLSSEHRAFYSMPSVRHLDFVFSCSVVK